MHAVELKHDGRGGEGNRKFLQVKYLTSGPENQLSQERV